MKILIIEDDKNIVKTMEMLLKTKGHDILKLASGLNAVEIVENQKPDLIFLDIMLPKINGITICEIIKKNYSLSEIPVVFISARSSDEDINKAMEAGGDGYLVKPFGAKELMKYVNKFNKEEE